MIEGRKIAKFGSTDCEMANGARVPCVDTDLEAGQQTMTEEAEMEWRLGSVVPISMVRGEVRAVDVNSYTPHSVSIGPYHASCSSPRIEEEKLRCVRFLQSLSEDQKKGGLMGLAEELEPLARAWYPDGIGHVTPEELSTMLLRDGCYLLGCMMEYPLRGNNIADDKLLAHSLTSRADGDAVQTVGGDVQDGGGDNNTVVRDTVFLVENQIPFFVLQNIHEHVTGDTTSSALEFIADYVQELLQVQLYICKHRRPAPTTPPSHLLHLLHTYLQPTKPPQAAATEGSSARPRTGRWRRATEYCKYGNVRFKLRKFKNNEKWTFLDVRLQGGTLFIPPLRVDSMTWTVLRNLMALEEGTPRKPVTAYCFFMSQVARNVEDVELLQRQKILEHFLVNDEDVAQGFANLCNGVVLDVHIGDKDYLMPYWHELHNLCNCPRNFWQTYCTDPMYLASIIVSSILFLFALAQVILAIPRVQKHLQ